MPLKVNIEKAKNIFQTNLQFSIDYEIEKIDKEMLEEDSNRLIELKEYYLNFELDLSEVENCFDLDKLWPETLTFKPSHKLFEKTIDIRQRKDFNEIAGCEMISGPFETTRILSAFNIPFILNRSAWNFLFVPQPEIMDKDKTYNYYYGWNQTDLTTTYAIVPDDDDQFVATKDMYELNYTDKRILLQKPDKSVIIIIPVNLKIGLEELIAKLSYMPEKKEWAYSEVFNIDELPSEKYRDAWELIGHDGKFYDKD
tara:strand:- start:355 stop:1119 length:765 start_codon:yes stop_codon:yes gene_type:complete